MGDIRLNPLTEMKMKVRSQKKVDQKSSDNKNSLQDDQVYENTTFIGEL